MPVANRTNPASPHGVCGPTTVSESSASPSPILSPRSQLASLVFIVSLSSAGESQAPMNGFMPAGSNRASTFAPRSRDGEQRHRQQVGQDALEVLRVL